jgi:hypothetical protein
MKQQKPRKYQSKLILHHMTFEQVIDRVLAFKPKKDKKNARPKNTRRIL